MRLNRAVAVAHSAGLRPALALLAPLLGDDRLDRYAALHAAHAELLHLAGAHADASAAYARAIGLTDNVRLRAALSRRASAMRSGAGPNAS